MKGGATAMAYLGTALAAALYWFAAAWLCFSVTGADPIDAVTGSVSPTTLLAVAGLLVLFVFGFALIGRAWHHRRRGIDG
ncbi:hypothetical protein DMC47_18335 [Nostoc sp. 3335mG]|nr:hypothetical protein DMC47_18335 [Nostoc sp. 3335mG]